MLTNDWLLKFKTWATQSGSRYRRRVSHPKSVRRGDSRTIEIFEARTLLTSNLTLDDFSDIKFHDDPESSHLSGSLIGLNQEVVSGLPVNRPQWFREMFVFDASQRVGITITGDDINSLLPSLQTLGFVTAGSHPDLHFVEGFIPIDQLDELSVISSPSRFFATSVWAPGTSTGNVLSQADFVLEADRVRLTTPGGVDGTGITVGVLSDSYNNLGGAAAGVTSGDLPNNVNVLSDLASGGSDEGRAMLELIHDIAPGASLAFSTAFGTESTFAQHIQDLAAISDVIVDDIFYFAEPYYQDGIVAQSVDAAVAAGVPYFSAAGNDANHAWETASPSFSNQTITNIGTGNFLDFDSGAGVDVFQNITVPNGTTFRPFLQWDDPFYTASGVDTNLDLFILDSGGTVVRSAVLNNISNQRPVEGVSSLTNNSGSTATYRVVIRSTAGPDPTRLKYVDFGRSTLTYEYATASSPITPHAAAAGGVAVAAVPYFNQTTAESFTSIGPTTILFNADGTRKGSPEVRQKPDLAAIDGTDTTFFGSDADGNGSPNFFGTSAAAPHAAAVAALMLQKTPTLAPVQIVSTLKTTATDIGAAGVDSVTGSGLINAYDAVLGFAQPASLIFSDGFESGYLSSAWETHSTVDGRLQVTSSNNPAQGSQHVTMGTQVSSSNSRSEMILHFNTGGYTNVVLSFVEREDNDSDNAMSASFTGSQNSDGVAFSVDGTNWFRVVSLTGSNSTGTNQTQNFNLSNLAQTAGVTLGSDVRVKFQQFGNASFGSGEGFAFDQISISGTPPFEFGDAPDTGAGTGTGNYRTLLSDNGPMHTIVAGLRLGAAIDGEAIAGQSGAANGDDISSSPDDEDGVMSPLTDLVMTVGAQPTITLRATNTTGTAATLFGWIDYDGDGDFENGSERASITVPNNSNGVLFTLTFPSVPSGASAKTYARFRLSTDAAAGNSFGSASDGEVEDYLVSIVQPSDLTVTSSKTKLIGHQANGGPTLVDFDRFGHSVTNLGDVDGDGVTDLAVGASQDDTGGNAFGAVYVLFMNTDGSVKSSKKIADGSGGLTLALQDRFGVSVAGLGDIDGDGVPDLAVGAYYDGAQDRGAVYVLRLNADGTVKGRAKIASGSGVTVAAYDYFGGAVAALGDLDGDGITDIAVGAHGKGGAANKGAVHIVLLNSDGTAKSDLEISDGQSNGPTLSNGDYFGRSVTSLGDIDGDGVPDLAVGATGDDTGGTDRGAVHILRLNSDGTVKAKNKIANGTTGAPTLANSDFFGSAVAAVGDQDGDGVTDLAVGAFFDDTGDVGSDHGAIHILLMNSDGTPKSSKKIAKNTNGGPTLTGDDHFGSAIAYLGNLDNDGLGDLAVGAYFNSTGGPNRGAVFTLFLKAAAPEIDVLGNGVSIADGDTTPATADHTDFGNVTVTSGTIVRTFTVANEGSLDVTLSGSPKVVIGGTNAADFTVTVLPSGTITPGATTTFQITFDPSGVGTRTATVSIDNNDANENPYNFTIQGFGLGGFTVTEIGGTTVSEPNTTDTVSVVLDVQPTSDVVITVGSSNTGEATVSPTSLTFTSVNWATPQTVTVTAADESLVDGTQTSTLTFSINDASSDNAFDPLADQTVTVTTLDDDSAVFSVSDASAAEGSGVTFTITLSKGTNVTTSVTFTTSNGTATIADNDYTAISGQTVTFLPGDTSKTVTVNTTSDLNTELDETFTATLAGLNAGGRPITISGTNGSATGTITNDDNALFTIADASAAEGSGVIFTITLSRPVDVATSVMVTTTDGSATTGDNDYTAVTSQIVNFAAGQTSKTITINTTSDLKVEADETFTATLGGVSSGGRSVAVSGTNGSATGTILNDDSVVFTIANATAIEGNGVVFTITLSNVVDVATSVTLTTSNGLATISDNDYTAVIGQTVTFNPGVLTQTVTVNTTSDTQVEGTENFTATLGGLNNGGRSVTISGTNGSATGTITDNDSAQFSIANAAAVEGSGVVFTITLSAAVDVTTSVTVTTSNGSATTTDNDYTPLSSQTVTFAPGVVTQTVTVNTTTDNKVEANETFTATLGGLSNGSRSVTLSGTNNSATGTINNDDSAVFSIANASAVEGSGMVFTITLSQPVDVSTSVAFTTSNGSALSVSDYSAITNQAVTFTAGTISRTVTVNTINDTTAEPEEFFNATLGGVNASGRSVSISGANGSATGTIADNDFSVSIGLAPTIVSEDGAGTLAYTFTRTGSTAVPVTVLFAVSGTGLFGTDYTQSGAAAFAATSGSVTILAGNSSATVVIDPTADSTVEAHESVVLTVSANAAYQLGTPIVATGTITNDDSSVFSVANAAAIEGSGVVFTISLTNPVDVATSVRFTTSNGTATTTDPDFTSISSQIVSFSAGTTSQTITVVTLTDSKVEANETFTATLGNLSPNGRSVTLSPTNSTATGTIINDDDAIVSVANVSAVEGNGLTFTITLSKAVDVATSVTFTTSDGSALLSDSDYTAVTGQVVSFPAGSTTKTVTVNTTNDLKVETDETFTATLGGLNAGGRSVTISGTNGAATGTITNNDSALFSISNATTTEGAAATFTITLSRAVDVATSVTVTTSDGTATLSDNDYTALSAQTVTFPAGVTSQTISVNTTTDTQVEGTETFAVALGGLNDGGRSVTISGTNSVATGTIADNDSAVFSIASASATEGSGVSFTITLSAPVDIATSVSITTSDGTARLSDSDYSALSAQTVTFAAGVTSQTVTVNTTTDTQVEGTETFTALLSGLNNTGRNVTISNASSSATGTIFDNDSASFSIANASATEGNGVTFTITLSNPVDIPTSVTLTTSDGSATLSDSDYSAATGQVVTFAAGTTSQTVTVNTTADSKVELNETFTATLGGLNAGGRSVTISGVNGTATGTITNNDNAVFSIANSAATEGNGVTFTITLSQAVEVTTSVRLTTANGSATTADSDYSAVTNQLVSFTAGTTSQTVTVNTTTDTKVELDETFSATLGSLVTGGRSVSISGANGTATGTITNDDAAVFSIAGASATEGGSLTFTVTLTGLVDVSTSVTFSTVDATATAADADFTAIGSQVVTFTSGQTSQTVTVNSTTDSKVELDESFTASLIGASSGGRNVTISGANGSATGAIVNNDSAVFSLTGGGTVIEGTGVTVTITLSNPVDVVTSIALSTIDGTATAADNDFTVFNAQAITFAAGQTTQVVTINTTNDSRPEGTETFSASLGTASVSGRSVTVSTTNNSAAATITDNDSAVFSVANASASEGSGIVFTISLSSATDVTTSVLFSTSNGTATTADNDYSAVSSQLVTFAPGDTTKTVTVNTASDNKVEVDETLAATLSGLVSGGRSITLSTTNAMATGTITNDDSAVFSIASTQATEGSSLSFTVQLSNPVDVATSLNVNTSDVTATTSDNDYTAVSNLLLTFAPGTTSQLVVVPTTTDLTLEPDETFNIALSGLSSGGRNVTIPSPNGTAIGTILNDDSGVTLDVSASEVTEDGSTNLIYTFRRVGTISSTLIVNFSVGGSASFISNPTTTDYSVSGVTSFNATAGSVTFGSGATSVSITVDPTADFNTELDESVLLTLQTGAGYNVGVPNSASATITDDDSLVTLTASPASVPEDGPNNIPFTFTRSGSVARSLTVNFIVGGSATFNGDYQATGAATFNAGSGSVTFAPGASTATVMIDPTADSLVEADETVSLALVPGPYINGSSGTVLATINNDESDITMSLTSDTVTEDGLGKSVYTFTRTGGTNQPLNLNFNVSGTAIYSFDYSQIGAAAFSATSGVLTFASGASFSTITLDPTADTFVEENETAVLTLVPGAGYNVIGTAAATTTIVDDDMVITIAASPTTVAEDSGTPLVYTFTRSGLIGNSLTVQFSVSSTATLGTDFNQSGATSFTNSGGSITFAPGATSAFLTLTPLADAVVESDEFITLMLANGIGYATGSPQAVTGTIKNDDTQVSLFVTPNTVLESGTTNLIYAFTRSGVTANSLTVPFSVGGTATLIDDYSTSGAANFSATSGSVTFAPGATTAYVAVAPVPDTNVSEGDETVTLTLLSSANFSVGPDSVAIGTILNQLPEISVIVTPPTVAEDSLTNLVYTFTRTGSTTAGATVNFSVSGAATFNADYLAIGATSFSTTFGSVTFAPGASTATVEIDPLADSLSEGTESVILRITSGNMYAISAVSTATGSITNVTFPVVSVTSSGSVLEDGTPNLVVTFTRTGSTSSVLTVPFSVGGTATFGNDYTQTGAASFSMTAGSVTFDVGVATKTITLDPTADIIVEANETIVITLLPNSASLSSTPDSATSTITNDDVDLGNIVSLDGSGQLHITDNVNRADRLTITRNTSNELVIKDSINRLTTSIGTLFATNEVRVPLSLITGSALIVDLNGGDDSLNMATLAAGTLTTILVNGGSGNDTLTGSNGNDTLVGGDGADSILGGNGNDGLVGDAGNDYVNGGAGDDTILGGADNDTLYGGAGNDKLVGQAGVDSVFGEAGIDRIAGGSGFGKDAGDVVTDLAAEIDEAFTIGFNGLRFLF